MTSKKFQPRAPQETGPTRKLRTMATPPSGAQNRKGAATDQSLIYVRAFRTDAVDPLGVVPAWELQFRQAGDRRRPQL